VYGDPLVHPQPESYWGNTNPIGPRACYDEGKRCAETLFFDYHRQHKTAIRVVRIFNTYGPRMQSDDGRVVPAFILQALRGEPMTVFGDGQQTRSFCYVGDLVRGLVDFMEQDAHTGPMNLGNTREMTMLELAEAIVSIVGANSSVSMKPLPLDDPRQRQPDITLARSLIGWEPRVDLVAGLTATVDYVKGELANAERAEPGQ
jgi:UDP-glucuronate decarboxylase